MRHQLLATLPLLVFLLLTVSQSRAQDTPPVPGSKKHVELPDAGGMITLIWCPRGTFTMGSPEDEFGRRNDETPHTVTLDGFWIAETETTQAQWQSIKHTSQEKHRKNTNPYGQLVGVSPGHPVYHVNFWDALDFCRRLTERESKAGRLPKGYKFSLPTEAQWEYACRAGSTTALYTGNLSDKLNCPILNDIAWFKGNTSNRGETPGPQPVAQKKPNAWGLYDMLGNVAEWCMDRANFDYDLELVSTGTYAASQKNPMSHQGVDRIYRGGSWDFPLTMCRSAARRCQAPKKRASNIGFRIVLIRAK